MLVEPAILKALKNDEFYGKIMTAQLRTIADQLGVKTKDIKNSSTAKRRIRKRIIEYLENERLS